MNIEKENPCICDKYLHHIIFNDKGIGYFLLLNLTQERNYDDLLSLSKLDKADLTFYLYLFEITELIKCDITIYEQNKKAIAVKNYLINEKGIKELLKIKKRLFTYSKKP